MYFMRRGYFSSQGIIIVYNPNILYSDQCVQTKNDKCIYSNYDGKLISGGIFYLTGSRFVTR